MKTRFLRFAAHWTFLSVVALVAGCSDDNDYKDVDGQSPTLEVASDLVHTNPGDTIKLAATIVDADGIVSVGLRNSNLQLNKTINLLEIYGEPLTTYELEYSFVLSEDLPRMTEYPVVITVTDTGGRVAERTVVFVTDNDEVAPTITFVSEGEVTALLNNNTVPLHYIVEDNQALDYVEVTIPESDVALRVEAEGKTKLDGYVELPAESAGSKTYNVSLKVVDQFGNEASSTTTYTVNVVESMPDVEKMYLSDVEDISELTSDVFGVPMRIERTGEYTYKANYYSQKAGTEIYFIPQKTDLYPIRFGKAVGEEGKLSYDLDNQEPIVLDQAEVYYEITFNTVDETYSVKTYSIDEAIDPIPLTYNSNDFDVWGDGSWYQRFRFGYMVSTPPYIEEFTQDQTNPHLFYLESLSLTAGAMNFAIHNWHNSEWWDYCSWYVDITKSSADDPEVFGYYGTSVNPDWTGTNLTDNERSWATPTVKTAGDYKLIFDAHLGRAWLIPN